MIGNDTSEIPDETYDALSEIFETCVEHGLTFVLADGVYAELAEYQGCTEARATIEDWLTQRIIEEAEEHVDLDVSSDIVRMETENFHGIYSVKQDRDGIRYINGGEWYHDEFDDMYEIEFDDPPCLAAEDEAHQALFEKGTVSGSDRYGNYPGLSPAERNRGGF